MSRVERGDVEGGLDDPADLQPEQGDLRLAGAADDWSREDWEQAAANVLRKARRMGEEAADSEVWAALGHTTYDGIAISPLGTRDVLDDLTTAGRPDRVGPWDVRAFSADGDERTQNAELLADLEGGATSVWVGVHSGTDVATLLEGVQTDLAPVVLRSADDPLGAAQALLAHSEDLHPATNLGLEPAGATGAHAALAEDAGVLGFVVDAAQVHDDGSSEAQELGWALAAATHYLRRLERDGVSVERAADLVEFRFAADDQQLLTIAKLRAARRLWARAQELCGVEPRPMRLHAVTSRPMLAAVDPWVNLLRTTVAAFAAGVGGADSITVLPFDSRLGRPDAFGRRLARNTSALLLAESHVAAVADPAGGAYALEQLTDDVAAAAWRELGRIEADGFTAFVDRVRDIAASRRDDVAHRRRPLTGVSEFPHLGEPLPERPAYDELGGIASYGRDFESLRLDPPDAHVFLATLGPVADHNTRAGFAANLLAAGGVCADSAGATTGVDDVIAAYDGQPVACVAGTDAAYAERGAQVADALRQAGARRIVVAGPPAEWADDACALGDDAVAFLTRTREALA